MLISKVYCRPHSESLSSWFQFLQLWGSYPSLPQSHHWLSTRLMVYNIYIFTLKILYDSITGFYKPTTNYLLNTTAQTVQPTCNQRSANDATNVQPTMQPTCSQRCNQRAVNDAIAKQNFPKFRLRSTNSLFKPYQITESLDHQRLKEELNLPTSQFIVCSPRVSEPIRFH